ncbi:MAG: hypothetical protein C3F11_18350 [Methylocystaceae bacterium]|nr:MAG: hypothetical protein C3F11_18350 [Methylocystaceae bacterium]
MLDRLWLDRIGVLVDLNFFVPPSANSNSSVSRSLSFTPSGETTWTRFRHGDVGLGLLYV